MESWGEVLSEHWLHRGGQGVELSQERKCRMIPLYSTENIYLQQQSQEHSQILFNFFFSRGREEVDQFSSDF